MGNMVRRFIAMKLLSLFFVSDFVIHHAFSVFSFSKFLGFNLSDFNSKGAIQCPDTNITAINWKKDFPGIIPANCLGWHLPSYFFDNLAPDYHPFYNATLFAIVRDLYERLLSEYYYRAKNVLHWNDSRINSAGNMNGWLTKRIKSRIDFINHPYPWKEPSYCFAQGHFIPQRKFIYQGDRKVVDHVLRFENLREEFDGLMKLYGLLNVSLPEQHTFKSNKTMGVKDFTNRTRQLIEQVYEEDFVTFDYPYYAGR